MSATSRVRDGERNFTRAGVEVVVARARAGVDATSSSPPSAEPGSSSNCGRMGEAVAVTNAAKQQESAAESGAGLGEAREAREARENERSAEAIPETLLWQTRARRLYNNDKVQLGIALLIFFNFLVSAVEKQVNTSPVYLFLFYLI
ncbi:hypothetical protein T492DRAFT_1142286 [Pavlovales sp. CCMP2436]|nr:hypothetical protein T492DRAFT_1142286 [Pavlovales sp. CCMP2436]